jgi:hypothetical protein
MLTPELSTLTMNALRMPPAWSDTELTRYWVYEFSTLTEEGHGGYALNAEDHLDV